MRNTTMKSTRASLFLLLLLPLIVTAWSGAAQQIYNQAVALGAATTLSMAPLMVANAVDMSGSYAGKCGAALCRRKGYLCL